MDLWIRSQDKMKLIKVNFVFLNYKNSCQIITNYIPDFIGRKGEYFETLGTYKSKERALEVLDEIQDLLKPKAIIQNINLEPTIDDLVYRPNKQYTITPLSNVIVYEMPEE